MSPLTPSTQPLHRDTAFIASAEAILSDMQDHCRSLAYATVLTDDGFEVASIAGNPEQHRRVASMASSIQALGDAVARELRMGEASYLIIAGEQGNIVQLRVPRHGLVLAAHFDGAETVGKALSIARLAVADLDRLDADGAA